MTESLAIKPGALVADRYRVIRALGAGVEEPASVEAFVGPGPVGVRGAF